MRKLTLGIAAAGAIVAATVMPAVAQVGVYAGPGGFGVELGAPGVYYGGPRYAYRHYDEPGWNGGYYARPAWHGHYRHGHYH